jgi:tetratricopeptide (TPR) repeat protein
VLPDRNQSPRTRALARLALAALPFLAACAGRPHLANPSPLAACRDPARTVRQLAWDSRRHQTLAHAFDTLPGPPNAGPRLAARLDRLADAWASARAASCKLRGGGLSRADFDARTSCQNAVLWQQAGMLARVAATPAHALTRVDAGIDELEDTLRRCERAPVLTLYRGPRALVAARIELAQVDVAIALGDGSWAQAVAHAAREPTADPLIAERLRLPIQIALAWGSWLRGQDQKASTRLTEISPDEDRFAAAALAELRLLTRGADDPEALTDGANALTAYRELLGPTDRRLVRIHRELARRQRLVGDLVAATAELDAAITTLGDVEDDVLRATLSQELGDLEHLRGDYRGALQHHRAALAVRERTFGAEQLPTAESIFGLGSDHEALGDLDAAISHYVRALKIQQAIGPDDLATARTYNNLGRACYAGRNFVDAKRFHTAALALRRRLLGEQNPEVATSLNNLGAVLRAEGDLPGAMKLFRQALDLRERLLGPDHPYTAISLNNIAEIHIAEGDLGLALALHERALQIRRKRFGEDHPETARSLHNLGVLQMERGDLDAAEAALTAAARIRGALLGPQHPETLASLERLKEVATRREQALARERAVAEPEPAPRRRKPGTPPGSPR